MTITYHDLIRDHDQIDYLVRAVLAATDGAHPDFIDIRYRLDHLSLAVSEHIAIEDDLIAEMKIVNLRSAIRDRYDGVDAFSEIKRDWMHFLYDWNAEAIEADFDYFRQCAEDVLLRLGELVKNETRVLYSNALQASLIKLK